MKNIDKIILKTFIKNFLMVAVIVIFILLIQIFLQNMKDIMGKNLGFQLYAKMFGYFACGNIPLALPIAILIASVLTFANLTEHLEIIAFKSIGMSFKRIIKSLIIFMSYFGVFIMLCTHYVTPKSWQNIVNLVSDLRQINLALVIKEGEFFNGIPGYSIYVESKSKDQNILKNILIYQNDENNEQQDILITAKEGCIKTTHDGKSIILEMHNGYNYIEKDCSDKKENAIIDIPDFIKMQYGKQNVYINSSMFQNTSNFNDYSLRYCTTLNLFDTLEDLVAKRTKIIDIIKKTIFEHDQISDFNHITNKENNENKENNDFTFDEIYSFIKDDNLKLSDDIKEDIKDDINDYKKIQRNINTICFHIGSRSIYVVACFIMLILGCSIGYLINKNKKMGLHIILTIIFVIIFNVTDILAYKWINIGIINYILGMFLSTISLLPFMLLFYLLAKYDKRVLNSKF